MSGEVAKWRSGPGHVIGLFEAVWRGLKALVLPHRAFRAIGPNERLAYAPVLLFMAAWGVAWATMHLLFIVKHGWWEWYFVAIKWPLILNFVLMTPELWLVGSLGWYALAKWGDKYCVTGIGGGIGGIERIEVGVWYLLVPFMLMPIFDIVHYRGAPTIPVLKGWWDWFEGFTVHASWLFVFPVFMAQCFFFLRDVIGLRRPGRWLVALAVALPIMFRAGVFTLPYVVTYWLTVANFRPPYWVVDYHVTLALFIGLGWCRLWVGGLRLKPALFGCAVTALAVFPASIYWTSERVRFLVWQWWMRTFGA